MWTFNQSDRRPDGIVLSNLFLLVALILMSFMIENVFQPFAWAQSEKEVATIDQVGFKSDQYEVLPGEGVEIAIQINKAELIQGAFLIDLFFPGQILQYTGDYLPGDIDTTLFLVHQPDPHEPLIKIAGVIGPEKQKNQLSGSKTIVSLRFLGQKDMQGCGELRMNLLDDLREASPMPGRVCLIKSHIDE